MAFSGETAAVYHRFLDGDREVRNELTHYVDEYVKESFGHLASEDLSEGKSRAHRAQHPGKNCCRVVSLGDGPGVPGVEVAQMLREKYGNGPVRFDVFSTDLSEDMCQQARERAKGSGFDVNVIEEGLGNDSLNRDESAEGTSSSIASKSESESSVSMRFIAPLSADDPVSLRKHFLDSSVDVILMSFVLMFVENRETCFAEAARMLKPGGTLVFCVLNKFLMIDVVSNALAEVLRDEDMNLKLCRPIRPVPCLALKDWAVYEDNHIDGSDQWIGEGLQQLLSIAAPSLEAVEWSISEYDFPLGCREGEEDVMLDMFCSLISDESWAAIAERAPHLKSSIEQAKREVREYVSAVVTRSGVRNRWRYDDYDCQYEGNMYCCPDYAAPVVCCRKQHDGAHDSD